MMYFQLDTSVFPSDTKSENLILAQFLKKKTNFQIPTYQRSGLHKRNIYYKEIVNSNPNSSGVSANNGDE